jgi:hypothetical protein
MSDALPINTLAFRPEPGHNRPLLQEILQEELAGDKARAEELLASAREAKIETADDAAKVADLVLLIRLHERTLDSARDARKRPYAMDARTVDAAYGALIGPLARARTDSLSKMLDDWRSKNGDVPLATAIAAVGNRREINFCIEDLQVIVGWLLQTRPGEIAQAARTIIGAHLKALGVEHAAEAGIPGISVTIQSKAQVR